MKAEKMNRSQTEENKLEAVLPSLPVRIALLALRFYKTYLSFLFAGNCRFDPTCSQYAYQAIERFGVARGVWLGLQRLLRCHPLSRRFGYDPVPETWKSTFLPGETTARELLGTSPKEAGLRELRVTSHQPLHSIHAGNFKIQDEVHS